MEQGKIIKHKDKILHHFSSFIYITKYGNVYKVKDGVIVKKKLSVLKNKRYVFAIGNTSFYLTDALLQVFKPQLYNIKISEGLTTYYKDGDPNNRHVNNICLITKGEAVSMGKTKSLKKEIQEEKTKEQINKRIKKEEFTETGVALRKLLIKKRREEEERKCKAKMYVDSKTGNYIVCRKKEGKYIKTFTTSSLKKAKEMYEKIPLMLEKDIITESIRLSK